MDELQKRHFEQTSDAAGMPKGTMDDLIGELETMLPQALDPIEALTDNISLARLIESVTTGVCERYETLTII